MWTAPFQSIDFIGIVNCNLCLWVIVDWQSLMAIISSVCPAEEVDFAGPFVG